MLSDLFLHVLTCLVLFNLSVGEESPWYQGCYHGNVTPKPQGGSVSSSPAECAATCAKKGEPYAAIHEEQYCACRGSVPEEESNQCISCQSYTQLQCGGNSSLALYNTTGPFLLNATLRLLKNQHVFVLEPFVIQKSILFGGPPNSTVGLQDNILDDEVQQLSLTLVIDGRTIKREHIIKDAKWTEDEVINITSAGNHTIRLLASNVVSSISTDVNVTVQHPVLSEVVVSMATAISSRPSCIPKSAIVPENVSPLLVFANETARFVASVGVGYNVTFDWRFGDGDEKTDRPFLKGCAMPCRSSEMAHIYQNEGHYVIEVTARNQFGRAHNTTHLMVIRRRVVNLTVEVEDQMDESRPYLKMITPDEHIRFNIAVHTTDRQDTILEINHGDGMKQKFSVVDKFGELLGDREDGPDRVSLRDDYGDSNCILSLSWTHTYKSQGYFIPRARIFNNGTDLRKEFTKPIAVLLPVEIHTVNGEPEATVGKDYEYIPVLRSVDQPIPINVTYSWVVSPPSEKAIRRFDGQNTLHYEFDSRGNHRIQLIAENPMNSDEHSFNVFVHEDIGLITVDLLSESNVKLGQPVTLKAVAESSHVNFDWEFHGSGSISIQENNRTSEANFTYQQAGNYTVEVNVSTDYDYKVAKYSGQIQVLEPVNNLIVDTTSPTKEGNGTTIRAEANGSNVRFQLKYDNINLTGSMCESNRCLWNISFKKGDTYVTIIAQNLVSEERRKVVIEVEEDVRAVYVMNSQEGVQGENIVFQCRVKDIDVLSDRQDLIYVWKVRGQIMDYSTVPIFNHVFRNNESQAGVGVEVRNKVCGDSCPKDDKIFRIFQPSEESRFVQGGVLEFSQPAKFSIVNLPHLPDSFHVKYAKSGQTEKVDSNLTSGTTPFTWSHNYSQPGVYNVEATIKKSGVTHSLLTVVTVQERITDVRLNGPRAVPVREMSPEYEWEVTTGKGSHMLHEWFIDGQLELQTPKKKFRWRFEEAGEYNISVRVSNYLGAENISSLIIAEYAIHKIELQALPVFLGDRVSINITVHGGPMIKAVLNFGDGNITEANEDSMALEKEQIEGIATGQHGPTTRYSLYHLYKTIGCFELVVNVSNHVFSEDAKREICVEEPIGNISLTVSDNIVDIGKRVVVTATVSSGQNIKFDWYITHGVKPDVESNNRLSTASFTPDILGSYNVTVYVSNTRIDYAWKSQSLLYSIKVQENVSSLNLESHDTNAPLTKDDQGLWRTKPINFRAWVTRGSDVVFHFNYGDGHNSTVSGVYENDSIMGKSSHVYHEGGKYRVDVTASNLLGSTSSSLSIFVQKPPVGCALSPGTFYVQLGSFITLNATYLSGASVTFYWNMGDNKEYTKKGPSISHRYDAAGTYRMFMVCENKVGNLRVNATIHVVSPITDVRLKVKDGLDHSDSMDILFEAVINPSTLEHDTGIKYWWSFGDSHGSWRQGSAIMVKQYNKVGRYKVFARAINAVSNKTSDVVQINIIQPINELKLSRHGEPLINRKLTFDVYHYGGTDVSYDWNFGDGYKKKTRTRRVEHLFSVIGQYNVSVTASNSISNRSASLSVFILHKPCSPPQVELLIPTDSQLKVTRSQDFKLESKVTINCSITSAANYTWTLRNGTTRELKNLTDVPSDVFHDPRLYIRRHALDYGNYSVELKVVMQGTIVYTTKEVRFSVIPSDLLSIINGGIRRRVQRNETIIMDASGSYDPDYPNAPDISFNWECYHLETKVSCFKDEASLQLNYTSNILILNGTSFNTTKGTKFVFDLKISRPGRKPIATTQVLDIANSSVIDMIILCSECENGMVNSDQRLILEAEHPGFEESELEYEWRLFLVDGDHTPSAAQAHDELSCVKADGSSYHAFKLNSTLAPETGNQSQTSPGNASTNVNITATLGDRQTSTTATDTRTEPGSTRTSTTTTPERSDIGEGPGLQLQEGTSEAGDSDSGQYSLLYPVEADPNEGRAPDANPAGPAGPPTDELSMTEGSAPGQLDGTIQEGHSGGRFSSGSSSGRRGSDPPASPEDGSAGTPPLTSEGRGNPRGSGSGSGRGSGQSSGSSGQNSIPQENQRGSEVSGEGTRTIQHIISKPFSRTRISVKDTTTGLNQRALVIKKDVLKQGKTYIIEALIKHRATDREGSAAAYVRINESPGLGQCFLTPLTHGVEIDTSFSITCMAWKDDDEPIQYEISYSLDNGKSRNLIYQGLNHGTSFQLPAGKPELNNTVLVNIAILDKYGARTTVCSLPVTVVPKPIAKSVKDEEELLEKENTILQTYVSEGDNRNARLHTQLVAHRLNRLHKDVNDVDNSIRAKIRTTLLHTLKDLPMRDEVSHNSDWH